MNTKKNGKNTKKKTITHGELKKLAAKHGANETPEGWRDWPEHTRKLYRELCGPLVGRFGQYRGVGLGVSSEPAYKAQVDALTPEELRARLFTPLADLNWKTHLLHGMEIPVPASNEGGGVLNSIWMKVPKEQHDLCPDDCGLMVYGSDDEHGMLPAWVRIVEREGDRLLVETVAFRTIEDGHTEYTVAPDQGDRRRTLVDVRQVLPISQAEFRRACAGNPVFPETDLKLGTYFFRDLEADDENYFYASPS